MSHDYSAFKEGPTEDLLSRISHLAGEQKTAERRVAELEEQLTLAKNELRHIAEVQLPNLMDEAGMEEFTTRDGIKVKINEVIRASLPKGREQPAFEWLAAHQHEDLIKQEFKVPFDRDQGEQADALREKLEELGFLYEAKRTIHPATLSSFVKEQLAQGVDIPLGDFGATRMKTAKITVKEGY